jgi:hypothetical protein
MLLFVFSEMQNFTFTRLQQINTAYNRTNLKASYTESNASFLPSFR